MKNAIKFLLICRPIGYIGDELQQADFYFPHHVTSRLVPGLLGFITLLLGCYYAVITLLLDCYLRCY